MGGRNQGLRLNKASIRGKLARPYLNKQAECGGSCQLSQLRGGIGRRATVQGWLSQKTETYLGKKKKLKQNGLRDWLKWYNTCLARLRP
jgi:hypothetical protein